MEGRTAGTGAQTERHVRPADRTEAHEEDTIDTTEKTGHSLDSASVLNAKETLLELLGRAGVFRDEADELIALVEAGALADAHAEVTKAEVAKAEVAKAEVAKAERAPGEKGDSYDAGWHDGARAVGDALARLAERALDRAIGTAVPDSDDDDAAESHHSVGRVDVERAKVAVTPLYLSFNDASDLEPEGSDEVLAAVLGTMSVVGRVGYAGQLEEFTEAHRERMAQLYARFGPRSHIALHGRYSLLHSPTSIAVLERLTAAPSALRAEWDQAELPPAWLEGLLSAWNASEDRPG
ncbi:hypothetical protein [Streptomyces sp. NPDC002908]|uniref:hypothetical protein n=1 Tax=Streptomyces sp. NPDC002908 TaxID=3364670 RepID=UPI0036CDBA8D